MKSGLRIFGVSNINHYLVYSFPINKICASCRIFSAISVLLTPKNSNDLEIRVPDGARSLKVTPVNKFLTTHVSFPISQ